MGLDTGTGSDWMKEARLYYAGYVVRGPCNEVTGRLYSMHTISVNVYIVLSSIRIILCRMSKQLTSLLIELRA
jgi:hypothetical protein